MNFESAPFKLTKEYVKLMGGLHSNSFKKFKTLFFEGFKVLQKQSKEISAIVEVILFYYYYYYYHYQTYFGIGSIQAELLSGRLKINENDILRLIDESYDSWRTKQYDNYQYTRNNIYQ